MSTGNPERDKMIRRSILLLLKTQHEPSYANMPSTLPPDFDLLPAELSDALAEMAAADQEVEVAPEMLENFEPSDAVEPEQPSNPTAEVAPVREISILQSHQAIESAHKRLGNARVAVQIAQQRLNDTKAALAKSITAWQTRDTTTAEQRQQREIRAHLAGEQQRRQNLQDIREGKVPAPRQPNRPGPSVIDRTQWWGTHGDAADCVRGTFQNGGHHHGAFPAHMRGRKNCDPRRGPTVKLPSTRVSTAMK